MKAEPTPEPEAAVVEEPAAKEPEEAPKAKTKSAEPGVEKMEIVEADPDHEPHGMLYMCIFLMVSITAMAGAFWFFFLRV